MPANSHRSARGSARGRHFARQYRHQQSQLVASISKPMPTMMRTAKKSGSGGGCESRKSFRPLISPSTSCVRIRLASFGTSISK